MTFKSLSSSVMPLTKPVFKRKFVKLGRIYEYWPQILGEDLKHVVLPIALKSRRNPKDKSITFILHVTTKSAYVTRLSYQKGLILGRIHHIFGEQLVHDIKIFQNDCLAAPSLSPRQDLTETQKNVLSDMISNVDDEDLQQRLTEFCHSSIRSKGKG